MSAPLERRHYLVAAGGGLLWLLAIAAGGKIESFFQTIEILVWLALLVVVPLGSGLRAAADPAWSRRPPVELARRLSLPAALLAVLSSVFSQSALGALLALPWLGICGLLAMSSVEDLRRFLRSGRRPPYWAAAHLLLPIGALALLQSRAGVTMLGITEPIVLLTAIHFHYAAFAGPLFAAATGRLTAEGSALRRLYAWAMPGVVLSSPILALGWIASSPALKLAAVVWLSLSLATVSVVTLFTLGRVMPAIARLLLGVASLSVLAGLGLAFVYAAGELIEAAWITIPRMTYTHGLLNGFGFSLLGLLGWALAFDSTPAGLLEPRAAESEEHPARRQRDRAGDQVLAAGAGGEDER